MNLLQTFQKKLLFLVLFGLVIFSGLQNNTYGNSPNSKTSIIQTYSSSENSVERRLTLLSLNDYDLVKNSNDLTWINELLGNALSDKSPVVVSEAVRQIGRFQLDDYGLTLINLFNSAESLYGASGYNRRVQYEIILTLGFLPSLEVKTFIEDLLAKDEGTAMGQFLLTSIENLADPLFLNVVKNYKHKMHAALMKAKNQGDDPILYSRKKGYVEYALEIEQMLIAKGGK